ncbi:MAG: class IV adenylate cyclase [Gallionellaceae bacterium]
MEKFEVEIKYFVGKEDDAIRSAINNITSNPPVLEEQEDLYYTSAHKDFIKSEECLRIRTTGDMAELTWKPPTTVEMTTDQQYWKEEIDINISGQGQLVMRLLERLDFILYVKVAKKRYSYKVDVDTEIALDYVDPLGVFVEIETIASNTNLARAKNEAFASQLGLQAAQRVFRPYRDMVKEGAVWK